jgi:hypothetical protein
MSPYKIVFVRDCADFCRFYTRQAPVQRPNGIVQLLGVSDCPMSKDCAIAHPGKMPGPHNVRFNCTQKNIV